MYTVVKMGGQIISSIAHIRGLSKDTKPIDNIPNGSEFYCMDNGEVFMFDAENNKWISQDF